MPADEQTMRELDEAAAQAKDELFRNLHGWNAVDMAVWWKKWYMLAGHKRLGRILVDVARQHRTRQG